jgi:putative transcriptional regulator
MVRKTSKAPPQKRVSRVTAELLEMASDMHATGLLPDAAYDKITMRHMGKSAQADTAELTGDEIRAIREKARLSQAVFAHHLKLTVGHVSKLERGAERAKGPTLVLLDVIRRKGIEAIL